MLRNIGEVWAVVDIEHFNEKSELKSSNAALHARTLSSVLDKLARWPRRLADLEGEYFSTQHWNEKNSQDDGTIFRETGFVDSTQDWVLSGPHFFVANPYYKCPQRVVTHHLDYDSIDLEVIPDDYLPRTNYRPMQDREEYLRRMPRVSWKEEGEVQPRGLPRKLQTLMVLAATHCTGHRARGIG